MSLGSCKAEGVEGGPRSFWMEAAGSSFHLQPDFMHVGQSGGSVVARSQGLYRWGWRLPVGGVRSTGPMGSVWNLV